MDSQYTENFNSLTPTEQAAVLAVYDQQVFKWVKVGTHGFVWRDNKPPQYVVRKTTLQTALANIQDEIANLGYANAADIETIFETEKLSLGYDVAVKEYKRRRGILKQLKQEEQQLTNWLALLV